MPISLLIRSHLSNFSWYNFHSGEEVKLDKDRRFLVNNKVEDLVPLFQLEGTIV